MKSTILAVLALAGLSLGHNCHAQEAPAADVQSQEAAASNTFAVDVFRNLAQTQPGNLVFSPTGLEAILRLLQQGARGETAAELNALPLGQAVAFTAMNPQEACALFLDDSFELKEGITVDSVYRLPLATNPVAAANAINNWVDIRTNGLIPAIVSAQDFSPLTRMVAAGALYLKERWLHPFNRYATQQDVVFTQSDGTLATVTMMHNQADYRYAEGEDWQAVVLYYDTEGRLGEPGCFIGILPKGDARDFASSLTPDKFQWIRESLALTYEQDTIVMLPRFEVNPGTLSLVSALNACGLNDIFTPTANFSGFSNKPLYISNIIQRCYVKTDEEGTEAAAVTAVTMDTWSAPPDSQFPREIIFNRPFIWVICDLNTNTTPYFMGLFEQP